MGRPSLSLLAETPHQSLPRETQEALAIHPVMIYSRPSILPGGGGGRRGALGSYHPLSLSNLIGLPLASLADLLTSQAVLARKPFTAKAPWARYLYSLTPFRSLLKCHLFTEGSNHSM